MTMLEKETFGVALRTARERCGLSLKEIAEITSVPPELWRDLERDDLAFWPDHLSASICVRRYATAVGLDAEAVAEEFTRAHPPQADRVGRLLRANPALVHEIE